MLREQLMPCFYGIKLPREAISMEINVPFSYEKIIDDNDNREYFSMKIINIDRGNVLIEFYLWLNAGRFKFTMW